MQYLFRQAVRIGERSFRLGIQEVPEATEQHPHFIKFVQAGFIQDPKVQGEVSTKTEKERADALLETVLAKKKPSNKVSPEEEEKAPKEETDEDKAPQEKKKSKKS